MVSPLYSRVSFSCESPGDSVSVHGDGGCAGRACSKTILTCHAADNVSSSVVLTVVPRPAAGDSATACCSYQ